MHLESVPRLCVSSMNLVVLFCTYNGCITACGLGAILIGGGMGGQIGASGLENLLSEDEQAPLRGWALGRLVMLGHQCTPIVTTKCFWTIRPVFNMAGVSEKPLVDRISEWGGRIGGSGLNLLSEDGQSCWAATTVPATNIKYSCGLFGGKFATWLRSVNAHWSSASVHRCVDGRLSSAPLPGWALLGQWCWGWQWAVMSDHQPKKKPVSGTKYFQNSFQNGQGGENFPFVWQISNNGAAHLAVNEHQHQASAWGKFWSQFGWECSVVIASNRVFHVTKDGQRQWLGSNVSGRHHSKDCLVAFLGVCLGSSGRTIKTDRKGYRLWIHDLNFSVCHISWWEKEANFSQNPYV